MGFIDQESGSMAGAELCHGTQVGTGALHAEQALRDHQGLLPWVSIPAARQLAVQIDEVVVGKALKLGTTGLHACEEGVMAEPVRQNWRMAVGKGKNGGKIGLKAAWVEQNAISIQPVRELLLELVMHRAAAAHQPGPTGPHAASFDFFCRCRDELWVLSQIEVIVAG
jgi:hypothetical protein